MQQPLVISVILNTNRRDDTLACLDSLAKSSYKRHQILVLDNASSDGSVEAIRATHPEVDIIALRDNRGYAGNNNVGIQAALQRGADWVLVLNEDTVLAPDCIALMVAAGEADAKIGIVGPLVLHYDEPEVIQSAGGELGPNWEARHLAQNEPLAGQRLATRDVEWISGCAIMVRAPAIKALGALDERFFYYWEETEWCLRIGRAGWRIVHVPAAHLWHKGVQRNYQPKPSVSYYNTRNRLMMLSKHRAPLGAWLAAGACTLRTIVSYSVRPKWREKRGHRDAMVRGAVDFFQRRYGRGPF